MGKKYVTFWIGLISILLIPPTYGAWGLNFSANGFIPMREGKISNIIITNKEQLSASNSTSMSILLIYSPTDIFTPVKDKNLIIKSNSTRGNFYNYSLSLKEGQKSTIRFLDSSSMQECIISFEAVSKDKASFSVFKDTTAYGCGVDSDGYIGVNANY